MVDCSLLLKLSEYVGYLLFCSGYVLSVLIYNLADEIKNIKIKLALNNFDKDFIKNYIKFENIISTKSIKELKKEI